MAVANGKWCLFVCLFRYNCFFNIHLMIREIWEEDTGGVSGRQLHESEEHHWCSPQTYVHVLEQGTPHGGPWAAICQGVAWSEAGRGGREMAAVVWVPQEGGSWHSSWGLPLWKGLFGVHPAGWVVKENKGNAASAPPGSFRPCPLPSWPGYEIGPWTSGRVREMGCISLLKSCEEERPIRSWLRVSPVGCLDCGGARAVCAQQKPFMELRPAFF